MVTTTYGRRFLPVHVVMAAAIAFGMTAASNASAQFEVYENFNRSVLDVKKFPAGWMSGDVLAAKRKIENGKLVLYVYGRNDTTSDEGRIRARQDISFPEGFGDTVSGIEVTGSIGKANVRGCDSNPDGRYRSRLTNYINWGNDGSSTGPDDQTGDFKSLIGLRRYVGDPLLYVSTYLWRCADANCDNEEDIRDGGGGDLGAVAVGQNFTIRTTLNRDSNQIVFSSKIGGQRRTLKYRYRDGISPILPAVNDFTVLRPQTELDNCILGGGKKPFAFIEARIDSVSVKPR